MDQSSNFVFSSFFSVVMGGAIFFFVESKFFEFSVEDGGTFYMLRIYERSMDSLRLVFMAKESAKHLLSVVEELMSNVSLDNLHEPLGMEKKFSFYIGF